MYRITLLSDASGEQSDIAALSVLSHRVDLYPLATSAKRFETAHHDVVMIDARRKLIEARNTAQALKTAGLDVPLMMVLTEGGMAAVSSAWMVDDIVLDQVSPVRAGCTPAPGRHLPRIFRRRRKLRTNHPGRGLVY